MSEVIPYVESPLKMSCKREAEFQLAELGFFSATDKTIEAIADNLYYSEDFVSGEVSRQITENYVDEHFVPVALDMPRHAMSITYLTEEEKKEEIWKQLKEIYQKQCFSMLNRKQAYDILKKHIESLQIPVLYSSEEIYQGNEESYILGNIYFIVDYFVQIRDETDEKPFPEFDFALGDGRVDELIWFGVKFVPELFRKNRHTLIVDIYDEKCPCTLQEPLIFTPETSKKSLHNMLVSYLSNFAKKTFPLKNGDIFTARYNK